MTKDDILNMPAGREMDALIAVKIIGWKVDDLTATSPTGSSNARIPRGDEWLGYYSTDIAAAWEVVEKMRGYIKTNPFIWDAFIEALYYESMRELMANISPTSICRAAYIAIMDDKNA